MSDPSASVDRDSVAPAPMVTVAAPAVAPDPAPPGGPNPFPPLILLACAMLLWMGFQTYALLGEREAILAAAAQLAPQVEAAGKVRASVDSIATGVKRLADGGNANARVIVNELARRGVTINPNSGQAAVSGK